MKTCLACGAENKDKNKYCNKCGTKFPIETVIPEVSPFAAAEPVQAKPETIINGYAFDDEPDSIVREEAVNTQDFDMQAFENEETMILDDQQGPSSQTFEQPAPEVQAFDMQTFENEETAIIDTASSASSMSDFENEETMIIDDQQGSGRVAFENEETAIIGTESSVSDFENEETMIIDDQQGSAAPTFEQPVEDVQPYEMPAAEAQDFDMQAFEDEETMILDDQQSAAAPVVEQPTNEAPSTVEEPPKAPNFSYAGEIPVYRDPQNDVEPDTAYIDHLRRLKGLLDDGIINEREYEQKKEQILGLHAEQAEQK